MKTLKSFLQESMDEKHNQAAKKGYDKLVGLAGTIGSHKGNVKVYYKHKGGQLERSLVGEHDAFNYSAPSRYSGTGHYFASRYSARPGHEVYTHVKLHRDTDLSDVDGLEHEIMKQNPHTQNTGHARSLAMDIKKYHGTN